MCPRMTSESCPVLRKLMLKRLHHLCFAMNVNKIRVLTLSMSCALPVLPLGPLEICPSEQMPYGQQIQVGAQQGWILFVWNDARSGLTSAQFGPCQVVARNHSHQTYTPDTHTQTYTPDIHARHAQRTPDIHARHTHQTYTPDIHTRHTHQT